MKKISACLEELNTYLKGILSPIDGRLQAELSLKPLDVELIKSISQRNLCLLSALARTSFNRSSNRLTLYMSSVLPYKLDVNDKAGKLAVDLLPAITKGLERFAAPWLDGEINDIECSNLSLPKNSIGLWGLRFDVQIQMNMLVSSGKVLGQLLEPGDLNGFEEAGGKSQNHGIKGETKWV